MRTIGWSALGVVGLSVVATAIAAACGGGGDDATSTTGQGGSGQGAGGYGGATTTATEPVVVVDGGLPPDPAYEGVDLTKVPYGKAPKGCVGGFDAASRKLALTLDADVSVVVVWAENGAIEANGVACASKDGAPATTASVRSIEVTGSAADETFILDLSRGPFGPNLLSAAGGVHVDLGAGSDLFAMRGTHGEDRVRFGSSAGSAIVDVNADGMADVTIAGVEAIAVSLGPGPDLFTAMGGKGTGDPLAVPLDAHGDEGDDQMQGGAANDKLYGGAGDDVFYTGSGAGADGADVYEGGAGVDTLDASKRTAALSITLDDQANDGLAGEGDDVRSTVENVYGGSGDDVIVGSAAANTLRGGPGNDRLDGLDGDDLFDEGDAASGADVINGGPGVDTVSYAARGIGVHVELCISAAQQGCSKPECTCAADDGEPGEGDNVVNVEAAVGGAGDDVLVGDDADNAFYGNAGDDKISGRGGNDTMYGDDGNDTLVGGDGDDYLDGAQGLDNFDGGNGTGDICVMEKGETQKGCELY
jgi:hypothetical protein